MKIYEQVFEIVNKKELYLQVNIFYHNIIIERK